MATIYRQGEGYTIEIRGGGGRRVKRLGRLTKQGAATLAHHVEQIELSRKAGVSIPVATVSWASTISPELHEKLASIGLVKPREDEPANYGIATAIGKLFDDFLDRRHDLRESTKTNYRQAKSKAVAFFGANRNAAAITVADAKDFRRALERTLNAASVSGFIKRLRAVFHDATERRILDANPFAGVRAGSQTNESRMHFVSPATIAAVIEQADSVGWRCLIALSRFGGLRTPSEIASLRIVDIDWIDEEIVIHSDKTRRQGKALRRVPIFAELRPYLRAACDAAAADQTHLLPFCRADYNPQTHLRRFLARAGVKPWPKLFQNLRASRETELIAQGFPITTVCRWIGNSPAVAMKHYLMVTPEDRRRAVEGAAKSAALGAGVYAQFAQNGRVAMQNSPQMQNPAHNGRDSVTPTGSERRSKSRALRRDERRSAARRAALPLETRFAIAQRKIERSFQRMLSRERAGGAQ